MNLYKNLVETALPFARAKKTKRVCAGIHYTMVEIERGSAGLAYTFFQESKNCCQLGNELNFWKSPADIIIKGYLSDHPLEISMGLATINAVFSGKKDFLKYAINGDVFSEIKLNSKSEILMIGYFEPVFKKLQGQVKKIWLLDKPLEEASFKISDIVHKIDIAIITSSSLVNKTLEIILNEVKDVPEVILMGPSTPLNPEIFRFTPITWLCGSIVENPELLFHKVCEGKGARTFFKNGLLKKVNIRVKK